MHVPDFRNIYPKSLIPMGERDRNHFIREANIDEKLSKLATHWLTAYLWREGGEVIGWEVIVYPSDGNGYFLQFDPYFDFNSPSTFAKAKKLMSIVELNIFNDTFTGADFIIEIVRW